MPKGAIVRGMLENFMKTELIKRGYQPVYTPHIGKIDLYKTSGHYPKYSDSQFPPSRCSSDDAAKELLDGLVAGSLDDDAQRILLGQGRHPRAACPRSPADGQKATGVPVVLRDERAERIGYLEQNCDSRRVPAQADELPAPYPDLRRRAAELSRLALRLAEFGTVYRYEQSGELSGMTRVRGFTQDDAHLFCTHEQVRGEFRATMELTQLFLGSLGLTRLPHAAVQARSGRPQVQGVDGDIWRRAEQEIEAVLDEMGLPFFVAHRRGRVLRAEGRFHRPRLHRPRVAAWHGPA